MYEIKKDELTRKNVFAGDFPIVKDVGEVATGKSGPGDTAKPGNLDKLCGIAADDSTDGGVVYYLTGEFFADGLTLPTGVTAAALKPAFRKLGIFLK